jgi:hypothetical protein
VQRWLEMHDAELALSTVVIAELAFGIAKIRPDERARGSPMAWMLGAAALPGASLRSPKKPPCPTAS